MSAHPVAAVLSGTPHRYPMLLLDAIESLAADRGRARKAVSAGEHGGALAFAPTLLVDALGQLAIAVLRAGGGGVDDVWYLGSIEDMRLGPPARPGDVVHLEAVLQRSFRGSARVRVRADVEQRLLAEGVMVLSTGGATRKRSE